MSGPQPIVSLSDLRTAGPSNDPWRRVLDLANRLSVDGALTPGVHAAVQNQVLLALTANNVLHSLMQWPSSAGHSGDELYFRSLEHVFFQYEVFRLLRGILTRPHTHWTMPCNGTCPSLLLLHVTLTHFRETHRPVGFVEDTINQEPLHMQQQNMSLRQASIGDGTYNEISDMIARYVARISALTIDDQEWYESANHVNLLVRNHPQNTRHSSVQEVDLGFDGTGDSEQLPTREGTYLRTQHRRSHSTRSLHSRPIDESFFFDPAPDPATRSISVPISPTQVVSIPRFTNLYGVGTNNTYPNASIQRHRPYSPQWRNRSRIPSVHVRDFAISEPPSSPPLRSIPPLRPRRLPSPSSSSSFEEIALSPLSRPPTTRLDPLAPSFYSNAFAGPLTPAETTYLNRADVALDVDRGYCSVSPHTRREIAAITQEALDRVGPVAGVAREEEWEERAAAMREVTAGHGASADSSEDSGYEVVMSCDFAL